MRKRRSRPPAVVDTNVPIVANRKQAEPLDCAAVCARALRRIIQAGVLVIDGGGLIFGEYRRYLSFAGEPGVGDRFFKWLSDNRYKPNRVATIHLADDPNRIGEFLIYPTDPELQQFDKSDRVFVAVALAHHDRPPIFNAVDSD